MAIPGMALLFLPLVALPGMVYFLRRYALGRILSALLLPLAGAASGYNFARAMEIDRSLEKRAEYPLCKAPGKHQVTLHNEWGERSLFMSWVAKGQPGIPLSKELAGKLNWKLSPPEASLLGQWFPKPNNPQADDGTPLLELRYSGSDGTIACEYEVSEATAALAADTVLRIRPGWLAYKMLPIHAKVSRLISGIWFVGLLLALLVLVGRSGPPAVRGNAVTSGSDKASQS